MKCHWESIGVLGPIYGLVARNLSDHEIAHQLNLTELTVHSCIAWLLWFLQLSSRADLASYAAGAQQGTWSLHVSNIRGNYYADL